MANLTKYQADLAKSQPTSRFDPYFLVLGIPPEQRPITYYRLLGLKNFEDDAEVIEAAYHDRIKAVICHPWANTFPASIDRLVKAIQTARRNLGKSSRRVRYNEKIQNNQTFVNRESQDARDTSSSSIESLLHCNLPTTAPASAYPATYRPATAAYRPVSRATQKRRKHNEAMAKLLAVAIFGLIVLSVTVGLLVAMMLIQPTLADNSGASTEPIAHANQLPDRSASSTVSWIAKTRFANRN